MRQLIKIAAKKDKYIYKIVRDKQTIVNTNAIETYKKVWNKIRIFAFY